mmetsp:Transcript_2668/g.8273  ORF Transcript_2668/g.8273 Transcript_2668/m.8273 type:complete len:248 (-) Transcript_2668:937-1680(-)
MRFRPKKSPANHEVKYLVRHLQAPKKGSVGRRLIRSRNSPSFMAFHCVTDKTSLALGGSRHLQPARPSEASLRTSSATASWMALSSTSFRMNSSCSVIASSTASPPCRLKLWIAPVATPTRSRMACSSICCWENATGEGSSVQPRLRRAPKRTGTWRFSSTGARSKSSKTSGQLRRNLVSVPTRAPQSSAWLYKASRLACHFSTGKLYRVASSAMAVSCRLVRAMARSTQPLKRWQMCEAELTFEGM